MAQAGGALTSMHALAAPTVKFLSDGVLGSHITGVAKRRRRRTWSDAEKRKICAQMRVAGVSVAQVARRYNVNANQVFNTNGSDYRPA